MAQELPKFKNMTLTCFTLKMTSDAVENDTDIRCHPILAETYPRKFETSTCIQSSTLHFLCSYCTLYKLVTIFTAYSIVSRASNVKSPYKSSIVTSDNYQVTLRVIRKRAVHIIKANVQVLNIILTQPSTPLGSWLVGDMLLQTRPCSSQALLHVSNVTSSMGLR